MSLLNGNKFCKRIFGRERAENLDRLETKNATIEAKGYQKAEELEANRNLVSNLERTSDAKAKSNIFLPEGISH